MKVEIRSSREFVTGDVSLPEITEGAVTCTEQFVGERDALLWTVSYVTDVGGFVVERTRQGDGGRVSHNGNLSFVEMMKMANGAGIEPTACMRLYMAAYADGVRQALYQSLRLTRIECEALRDFINLNITNQNYALDSKGLLPRAVEMLMHRDYMQKNPLKAILYVKGQVDMVLTAKGQEFVRTAREWNKQYQEKGKG